MKLGILSDLHMEFGGFTNYSKNDVDVYINAGDIHSDRHKLLKFVERMEKEKPYLWVEGNHDHWFRDFPNPQDTMWSKEINGISFAGATLWTDMSNPLSWINFKEGINDAVYIKNYTENDFINTHYIHRDFLLQSKADVVISHHAPSYQSVSKRFIGDSLNCCFATELGYAILGMSKPPKLWIHGHIHSESDYMIGSTRVICNPWGYPNEIKQRSKLKIVEI